MPQEIATVSLFDMLLIQVGELDIVCRVDQSGVAVTAQIKWGNRSFSLDAEAIDRLKAAMAAVPRGY